MKWTNPLVIVKSLNGIGVNPAIASRVIQAITPPSLETLSLRKEALSTPYSSNIYSTVLKIISDNKILNNKGLILVETDKLLNIDKLNLEEIFSKKIGSSYLQCFKKLLDPLK